MEKNRPCFDQRVGNVRAAVWENTSNGTGKEEALASGTTYH